MQPILARDLSKREKIVFEISFEYKKGTHDYSGEIKLQLLVRIHRFAMIFVRALGEQHASDVTLVIDTAVDFAAFDPL